VSMNTKLSGWVGRILNFGRRGRRGRRAGGWLGVEHLEPRQVLSVTSVSLASVNNPSASLVVKTDDSPSYVMISISNGVVTTTEWTTNRSWSFNRASFGFLTFLGGKGNDTLLSYVSDMRLVAYGNAGDDNLYGNGANDRLIGFSGNDRLHGDSGDDEIYGGAGIDSLSGGMGNDILVSIDGDNIVDPVGTVVDSDGSVFGQFSRSFSDIPLFSGMTGPQLTDAVQGSVGDCWLICGMSAVAQRYPQVLRQRIVDFGDGTYGVRLGETFYRVDAQLPVNHVTSTTPAFAKIESAGGARCLWSAIAEKAFAYHRSGTATPAYVSLDGGPTSEAFVGFGLAERESLLISRLAGEFALSDCLVGNWAGGSAIGLTVSFSNSPNPDPNAWLVNHHAYSVVQVNDDGQGNLISIVVRNLWGVDGRQASGNPNDGLITLTLSELWQIRSRLSLTFFDR
jgi:Ca2+-binding RTX toxin-like protein